jgi:predicted nuclease with RNAse H fold
MLFSEAKFVGVNSTAGERPMHYAVLDSKLKIHVLGKGDLEMMLALIGGLDDPVVAISAPQKPNTGVMGRASVRRRFNLDPEGTTWGQWRLCEYELRRRNIRLYNTPSEKEESPRWMQNGFSIYQRLKRMGFSMINPDDQVEPRTMIEVQSHTSYTVLLERRPFLKKTLEGRLQRQLALYLEGLDVKNPIEILELINRDHMLRGNLPLDELHSAEELDSLVNAYTASLTMTNPERVSHIGDRREGLIFVPTMALKDFYV